MALYNPSMQSLSTFLMANIYRIPDYQREYSWDSDDQVSDFWEDLVSLVSERVINNSATHFFGQSVIHENKDSKTYYLIDGQQRITTSIIALSVLRDKFAALKETYVDAEDEYNDIKSKYIGRYKESTGEDKLRFKLGENDRKFFRDNIQIKAPWQKPENKAQERIKKAYSFFSNKIDNYLSTCKSDSEKYVSLTTVLNTLLDGFQLLTLMTDNINEAFIIFETLNTRGKDLETADLLKNYFFMRAQGSIKNTEQIKEQWINMYSILERKEDTTKLIRYYWNCSRKYVHDKQLYKEISNTIVDYKDCVNVVLDLCKVAELYNALVNPNQNDYFSDDNISGKLIRLQTMKVSTFYPVMFSMVLRDRTKDDIYKVVSALDTMAFREFVIAGKNPNRIERFLADLALDIYKNSNSADDIVSKIKEYTMPETDTKNLLKTYKPSNANIAKFILREVENEISDTTEKKLVDSNKAINLEHIMPQCNDVWNYPAEEHSAVYTMLGNLTLLSEKLNKSASNALFKDKKDKYAKSSIKITKSLCDYDEWNADTIASRAEYLSDIIMKIWTL